MHIRSCNFGPIQPPMAFVDCNDIIYDRRLCCWQFYCSTYFKIIDMQNINAADSKTNVSRMAGPKWNARTITLYASIKFLAAGVVFGILLIKAEVLSWFRIQEMFRFESFHMYGIIGSAIAVGMVSI